MHLFHSFRRRVGVLLRDRPRLRELALRFERRLGERHHAAATVLPALIRPRPYRAIIAITAHCNARCIGCRYGRDFMTGHQLSWEMTRDLLDDARAAGIYRVRLYGGEPLLHADLPRMVAHCREIGISPVVTTNAVLLAGKIDGLYEAGLRDLTIGFYGVGDAYDRYTQRAGLFRRVEAGIAAVRDRYGDRVGMQLNWLLMRPTCSPGALHAAFALAEKYRTTLQVDLIHHSLPYFTEGPERVLQFRPEDRPAIEAIVAELLRLRAAHPAVIRHTPEHLRSIPDWLILGPHMKIPCTAYKLIWVGADGTVQMCYAAFKLGNLHERRLRDILFTAEHRAAARGAFALDCPGCHCEAGDRIMLHQPSLRKYGA